MMSWIFLMVPIIGAIILLIFFSKKVAWWEVAVLLVPSILIIILMNTIMISYRTSDTEYLGFYTTKVIYYEPWNERVSCRHPIYCTRTYPCGTSKSPRTCTSTYVCGHHHAYDVDYHPAYWTKVDNNSEEYTISQNTYNELKNRFGTKDVFIEMNRNYHTIDGDAYHTYWGGEPEKSDVITKENSYKNKIKASHSIFKFQDIDDKTKKKWNLYDYPGVFDYNQRVVLGKNVDKITERKLQYINGYYGAKKQFKMFILFFRNQSMEAAMKQRSLWEGGNKNEFIVCVGTDNIGNTNWVKCFSWMDKPSLEVEVEEYLMGSKKINLGEFADWIPNQIQQHWKRKDFADFEYLQVELTDTQLWWILIILMLYNIGASVWVVINEFQNHSTEDDSIKKIDFKKILNFFKIKR